MTSEEKELLNNFESRLRHLIYLHDGLKARNVQLAKQVETQKETLRDLRTSYAELDRKYKDLKSATAISLDGGDIKETKSRLTKLVREVDKCIALINS